MTPSRKKLITGSVLLLGVGVVVVAGISLPERFRPPDWEPFDASGSPPTDWERTYDFGVYDHIAGIQGDRDGGCALLGTSSSGDGTSQLCLLRLNKSGELVHTRLFPFDASCRAASLERTADGGYLMLANLRAEGSSALERSEDVAFKLDSLGEVVWEERIALKEGWGGFNSLIKRKKN